ncbi:SprT-like domain-containing protein [Pseudomonas oryzihabitans]|uniref:SprT-like domain-containing protein n=1 Tax=Pseudomonas oryzihabitans TaxID=47885 RepID=UPI00214EC4F9|nr:SprT-like domain-containing protein [Pseudomonas psychrotolerans]UUW74404.1 SprT-like domain-containing protein [Pseudomonas psychrotolerans]UUW74456.1 SprT-like domain-containing protein [Pseudomonas psychrotolerans]
MAGTASQLLYDEIEAAYDWFNERLYDGKLPGCIFTLQRKANTFGYYSESRFLRRNGTGKSDEIALNCAYFAHRSIKKTLSTLVHEQVHQWQAHFGKRSRGGYHNAEWADKMESIGLMPSDTGEPGGRRCGQQMTHYIIEGGPFDLACDELIESGAMLSWIDVVTQRVPMSATQLFGPGGEPVPQPEDPTIDIPALTTAGLIQPSSRPEDPKNKRKYTCPSCHLNVWGKPGLSGKLQCVECEVRFVEPSELVEVTLDDDDQPDTDD